MDHHPLPGAIPSPNIWDHPDVYEIENAGIDPEGVVDAAIRGLGGWAGLDVLDIGCGTGFHLPRYAGARAGARSSSARTAAASVVGVEPHPTLAAAARERVRALGCTAVEVRLGTAQALPLGDDSVDVAIARWAYFFGPGCESGIAEVERVLRPGGTFFVVDTDATRSTFGGWFARGLPEHDPVAVARFWGRRGFSRTNLDIRWSMPDRRSFEAVVRIELPGPVADAVLATHRGSTLDHAVDLWWRRAPSAGIRPS